MLRFVIPDVRVEELIDLILLFHLRPYATYIAVYQDRWFEF